MSKILSFFGQKSAKCSLTDLLSPHMNRLYRQAYKYCGTAHDAEDLLQDVMIECKAREQQLRSAPEPSAWLSRVLYHRFIDRYRKNKHHDNVSKIGDQDYEVADTDSPEANYFHKQILTLLELLSPPQRMVISLHDMEGHTLKEISELTDIPIGTLKSHLHRGRKTIKSALELQPNELFVR